MSFEVTGLKGKDGIKKLGVKLIIENEAVDTVRNIFKKNNVPCYSRASTTDVDNKSDVVVSIDNYKMASTLLLESNDLEKAPKVLPPDQERLLGAPQVSPDAPETVSLEETQPKLWKSLKPFQKEGIEFIRSRGGRGMIADDMGLGKTIQGIGACCLYKKSCWPLLIIAPAVLLENWKREWMKWTDVVEDEILVLESSQTNVLQSLTRVTKTDTNPKKVTKKRKIEPTHDARIVIVSYDRLSRIESVFDDIKSCKFKTILADESQYIKNQDSGRSIAVTRLMQDAKVTILLSGTAACKPAHLYPQFSCLRPEIFPTFFQKPKGGHINTEKKARAMADQFPPSFSSRYCKPCPRQVNRKKLIWEHRGVDRLGELHAIGIHFFFIRRLKEDVFDQFPKLTRDNISLTISKKEAKEMDIALAKLSEIDKDTEDALFKKNLMELYIKTSRIKIPMTLSYLETIFHPDGAFVNSPKQKIILFAHFKVTHRAIAELLESKNIPFIHIYGETDKKEKQNSIDQFQTDPDMRVAILSFQAASVGLTLTAAQTMIMTELMFQEDIIKQAEARIHRMGQTDNVTITYLVAEHTTDTLVWRSIQSKTNSSGLLMDGVSKKLDIERYASHNTELPPDE